MKTNDQNPQVRNTRANPVASQSGGRRPENKDNLDARTGEEQDDRGANVTHNRKEVKSNKKHH